MEQWATVVVEILPGRSDIPEYVTVNIPVVGPISNFDIINAAYQHVLQIIREGESPRLVGLGEVTFVDATIESLWAEEV